MITKYSWRAVSMNRDTARLIPALYMWASAVADGFEALGTS